MARRVPAKTLGAIPTPISMKKIRTFALTLCALGLAVSPALAAGKPKPHKAKAPANPEDIFAMFDINHNGRLDINERDNVKTAYVSGNKSLAQFDTNHDGKLGDAEISKIVPGAGILGK